MSFPKKTINGNNWFSISGGSSGGEGSGSGTRPAAPTGGSLFSSPGMSELMRQGQFKCDVCTEKGEGLTSESDIKRDVV